MRAFTNHVEVEELEIGNECYIIEGTVTYMPSGEDDGNPTGTDVSVEVGTIRRMNGKNDPELPVNRRARMLLKHGQMIREALRQKDEDDGLRRMEEARDR